MIFTSVGQNTIKDIREHFNADEWLRMASSGGWLPQRSSSTVFPRSV